MNHQGDCHAMDTASGMSTFLLLPNATHIIILTTLCQQSAEVSTNLELVKGLC